MRALITGINGFVGGFLFAHFSNKVEFNVFGLVRKKINDDDNIFTLQELSKFRDFAGETILIITYNLFI